MPCRMPPGSTVAGCIARAAPSATSSDRKCSVVGWARHRAHGRAGRGRRHGPRRGSISGTRRGNPADTKTPAVLGSVVTRHSKAVRREHGARGRAKQEGAEVVAGRAHGGAPVGGPDVAEPRRQGRHASRQTRHPIILQSARWTDSRKNGGLRRHRRGQLRGGGVGAGPTGGLRGPFGTGSGQLPRAQSRAACRQSRSSGRSRAARAWRSTNGAASSM